MRDAAGASQQLPGWPAANDRNRIGIRLPGGTVAMITRLLAGTFTRCAAPLLVLTLCAAAAPVAGRGTTAPDPACDLANVHIVADDRDDAATACEGAGAALDFLRAQGLDVAAEFAIEIVTALPAGTRNTVAGCFLPADRKTLVLGYAGFLAFGTWFGLPVDRSLYRALLTHETAHAIAACNFGIPQPTIQAQEYIAYVTMFSAMDPVRRRQVLSKYPGTGYETDQQMNATIYLCDPMRFGVQAYRHFLKEGNGRTYLHAILSGAALAE